MAITDFLGSFPNSQVKPRSPVRRADVDQVVIDDQSDQKILSEKTTRVKAIIKNEGPGDFLYDYEQGNVLSEGLRIPQGGAINIEGGGSDVYARAASGSVTLAIDDREG